MLYPLKFYPAYKEYLWGGHNLEAYGKKNSTGLIAESLELCSLKGKESIVNNGYLKGEKISALILKYGNELIGEKLHEKYKESIPIIIKFIDAQQDLSVQVHPSRDFNRKDEAWYILSAETNSKVIWGLKKGITKEILYKSIREKHIEKCLNYKQVYAGDIIYVPAV